MKKQMKKLVLTKETVRLMDVRGEGSTDACSLGCSDWSCEGICPRQPATKTCYC